MPAVKAANPRAVFAADDWRAITTLSRWRGIWLVLHAWMVVALAAFGGALPPVLWDGIVEDGNGLMIASGVSGWTLHLSKPGQSLAEAQPGPLSLTPLERYSFPEVGAPAALEARLK